MRPQIKSHNALIAVAALLAIGLAWFGVYPFYQYAKGFTTLIIIWFFCRFARELDWFDYLLGVSALLLCLGGDVALLFEEGFLYGLSSFLLGHLLFILLFSRLAEGQLSWLATLFVFIFGASYYIYISAGLATMALPVAMYVAVISLMAVWGVSLHKHLGSMASFLIMLGGFSFLISDGVLAYNRFVGPADIWHPIVLATYWLSLALIVNGLAKLKR